jgi:transposase-like protein
MYRMQEELMPVCSRCFSRNLVKFGFYKGKQKWHCLDCEIISIYVRKRIPQINGVIRKNQEVLTYYEFNKKATLREIGQAVGLSYESVRKILKLAGIKRKRHHSKKLEELI